MQRKGVQRVGGYKRRATHSRVEHTDVQERERTEVPQEYEDEEEEMVEMFDAHGVPVRSDVLIQCCLGALIK